MTLLLACTAGWIRRSGAVQIGNAGQVRPLKVAAWDGAGDRSSSAVRTRPWHCTWNVGTANIRLTLAPGDFLFLYSSGVVDARNANGEPFGFTRLERALTDAGERGMQAYSSRHRRHA